MPLRDLLVKVIKQSQEKFQDDNLLADSKTFGYSQGIFVRASSLILYLILLIFIFSCTTKQVAIKKERLDPPDEAYYLYILGFTAEKEWKWEDALKYYQMALDLDPSSP